MASKIQWEVPPRNVLEKSRSNTSRNSELRRLNELLNMSSLPAARLRLVLLYIHWTSIMIEESSKDHANVLPAVGLVKKIDFFIKDTLST